MNVFDRVISLVAPQLCLACGREGSVMCRSCMLSAGDLPEGRCVGCHALQKDSKTCKSCKSWLPISAVYAATTYDGIYEQLIRAYKFDVMRPASGPIAQLMVNALPSNINEYILCPIPTAPLRIRLRGFDHALLLAKEVSRLSVLKTERFLLRSTNNRQLGSSRSQRIAQMQYEFIVSNKNAVKGQRILLLDDVFTTGATLAAAARELRKAGAIDVRAVIYAQKI